MRKIAIWSSYNHGNFGDDLMAIQFAKEVVKNNVIPIVYRLDKRIADFYGVLSTDSVEELLDNTNAVIIGGGALFTRESWVRIHFRKVTRDFEHDFKELYLSCEKLNIPIFPLSIGGDGGGTEVGIPKWHQKLFSSELCKKGTVRLPDCLYIARQFGIEANYYDDVVFAAETCFSIKKISFNDGKLHIGVNLKKSDMELISLIEKLASDPYGKVCFHFIKTHLSDYGLDYEYIPNTESANIKIHRYNNLDETISFFASLDMLLTVKLHIGITSLSVGTPFLSYNGKDKTKSMLRSIGADSCIYTFDDLDKMKNFLECMTFESILKLYDFSKVNVIKQSALKHLNFVKESVL